MPLEQALHKENEAVGAVMSARLSDRLGPSPRRLPSSCRQGFRRCPALIAPHPDSAASALPLAPVPCCGPMRWRAAGLAGPKGRCSTSKYRLLAPPETDLDQLTVRRRARRKQPDALDSMRAMRTGGMRLVERLTAFLILVGLSGLAVRRRRRVRLL